MAYRVKNYVKIGFDIGALVAEKQAQYGDSHGKCSELVKVLYPKGIPAEASALTVIRVLDKLFRIANGNQGDEDAWRDIAGYSLLMCSEAAK